MPRRQSFRIRQFLGNNTMQTVANNILFGAAHEELSEGRSVLIRVQGQSMLPFFRSGAKVRIEPLQEDDIRRGNVLFAQTDEGHYLIHRLIGFESEDRVTLMGDGNYVGTESIARTRLLGCVHISALHRWLALGWVALRPVRKIPLIILHKVCRK